MSPAVLGALTAVRLAAAPGAPESSTAAGLPIRLRILVAECATDGAGQGAPIRDHAWLAERAAEAQRIWAPTGVLFRIEEGRFRPARCELLDGDERSALATHVAMDGAVTVLVVARIPDLDVPTYDLHGVHWRYSGADLRLRGRRWVFLTARADVAVLAHELGHYFGLAHDPAGGNVMAPGPSSPLRRRTPPPLPFAPRFTARQTRHLRRALQDLLDGPHDTDQN